MPQMPKATGIIKVFEMSQGKLVSVAELETKVGLKCGTFAASPSGSRHFACGNFSGGLDIYDIQSLTKPIWAVQAHSAVVNCIDGCGGNGVGAGAAELVTGGRDGTVKIWDPRVQEPVVTLEPTVAQTADCWSVAFGNAFTEAERCVAAGYDNGDVKLFDLRTMTLKWETNIKNGVCHVQFDRKDISMNKLAVSCLESSLRVYDLRTYHPTEGFACTQISLEKKSTLWGSHFLPQNREIFATCVGGGQVYLYKYCYPSQRKIKDSNGTEMGVAGTVELLNERTLATQPVVAFDWHPGKNGLVAMASLDQAVRVVICTKLDLY